MAGSVFPGAPFVSESRMSTTARLWESAESESAVVRAAASSRAANLAVAAGLKRRDPELLDRLIVEYQHRLLRYLLFLTGERMLAEDLFQETWMRVLTRGSQYNGAARFDTWLFTVARNLLIDTRRRRTMASLESLCANAAEGEEYTFEIPSGDPNPFDHYRGREESRRVAAALLTLEPVYREALALRFYEELSLEEIASVTQARLSTVKSRVYRGLVALRPVLEKEAR